MKIIIAQLIRLDRVNALFNADLSSAELTTLGDSHVELGEGNMNDLIEQGMYMFEIEKAVHSIIKSR